MDNLPIELLSFIFKHLGLFDLLRNRLVCKKWRFFIDEQKIKELTLYNFKFESKNWAKTNQLIDLNNAIKLDTSKKSSIFENHLTNLNLLSDLKCLKICSQHPSGSHFAEFINKFKKLEQLDIDYLGFDEREIDHQNLRIISIMGRLDGSFLKIDAPKLKVLIYRGCIRSLDLFYPETLIELHFEHCETHKELDNLSAYSNVELLNCYSVESNQNIISELPKLKELRCHYDFFSNKSTNRSLVKNFMNGLLEQNQNLNRSVEIYFQDILLSNQTDLKLIDEPLNILSDKLFLQIKNYGLLSKSNLNRLNYTNLMDQILQIFRKDYFLNSSIDNQLPNDFFNKFQNIMYIDTNEIRDPIHFIWFLKNCHNLISLSMDNPSINQNLYNNLPRLCKKLSHFKVNCSSSVNFNFILKLDHLITFETENQIPYSLVTESFITLKYLCDIRFKNDYSNIMKIKKESSKNYRIFGKGIPRKSNGIQLNLNELILALSIL